MARVLGEDPKTKAEKIPHTINWAQELDGATISGVAWDVDGLTNESTAQTTTLASIRLADGTIGRVHIVTCTITASDGAVYSAEIHIPIDE
jgi:hypothetical protein